MKQKGAMFLLECLISGNYVRVASCKTNTLTTNNETVDVASKSDLWRELLENAGISSVSVKAQGVLSNSASYAFIKDSVINNSTIDCKIISSTGEIFAGGFLITSFESSGEYNAAELVALTLESANVTTIEDNSFRLLEDGSFRLLEDGSRRLLEGV